MQEVQEEQIPTTMAAHEADGQSEPEPAAAASPAPVNIASESVPESSHASAAPEHEPVATPESATPEATTAAEPAPESVAEPVPELPFVPASSEAAPTQPDYQNDEGAIHADETPKMPATEEPATVPPTETHTKNEAETSSGAAAKENTLSLLCFSCTGERRGACSSNPRENITCPKNSKGCFTLIKR